MTLAEKIIELRDRTRSKLIVAHDYYADSVKSWDIVRTAVKLAENSDEFTNHNVVTGTKTSPDELVRKSEGYIRRQLAESTFQQFISIFEYWFFDLLRLWLMEYPLSLDNKDVDLKDMLKDVLNAPDKEAIVSLFIDRVLLRVAYGKPADWFRYLKDRIKMDVPGTDDIDCFTEAKAARDMLVHNEGIANKTYVQKAGPKMRFKDGDFVDIIEPYHREVWELTLKLVAEISDAAALKTV